jgi:hypothetical protein
MATVERSRSRKKNKPDDADVKQGKSHAFRNGCLAMLLLLCVAVFFAPGVIARTSLRNSLLQSALKMDGTVTLGSASLGWFSSVVVENIEVRDAEDQIVAEVAQLRTAKSLLGLLADLGNLGEIEVNAPKLNIVCLEQETNLERIFSSLIAEESEAKVSLALKLNDGTIDIQDVPSGREFHIDKLAVDFALTDSAQPIVVAASGNIIDGQTPGNFKLDLQTQRSEDGKNPLASGKVACNSTALPLELADPILRRKVDGAALGGRLSTRLNGAWGKLAESGEASVQGEALVSNLTFAAAALGHDKIELERIEVPCHLIQRGDTLEVQQLGATCELGNISLTGSAKMDDFSATDKLAALLKESFKLQGEVDLVALAKVLPETLRIREGTEITSGKIRLAVASGQEEGQPVWSGQVDASHLGATSDGRALVWENPLALDFAARQTPDGIVVDRAECTSSFLHASAAGSVNDLTGTANFDLARLVDELKQFADLSDLALTGQGNGKLELKRVAGDQFTGTGQFEVRGFQFVPVAGGQPWKEDKLLATLELGGKFEKETLKQIERAIVTVDVGPERLTAQLREPVADPATAAWPLKCSWHGELTPWATRLSACLGMTGWDLRGAGDLQADVTISSKSIDLEHAKGNLAQLQVWGNDWFINEPAVNFTGEARWDREKQRGEVSTARVTAGSTAAVVSNASLQQVEEGWKVDGGTAQFGADLVTLYRWRHDPRLPATWRISGRLAAQAKMQLDAEATTARIDGEVDQLVLVDLSQPGNGTGAGTWQESRITMAALATYRPKTEVLMIEQAQLAAAAIRCDAKGTVPLSAQGGDIDVQGTLQYDWQQLAALWRPLLGDGAQIAGNQTRKFAVSGRLTGSPALGDSWRQVAGNAAVGWSGMSVHGMTVGPGDIVANLAEGQIHTQPLDVEVSEGRLTFAPVIRLTPAPAEIYIPRGPLLTNLHLTPEMCKRGLKFVAPIVAETAVAEGRFSVSMDGGRIPLFDPKGGDVAGHMAIRAQVKPGPVAQEFFVLVNELFTVLKQGNFQPLNEKTGALMSIDTTDVEFRMVQRRVYHRNLKFVVGTMPITTHGSVGLDDESLSMVAEIPLQANLLGRDLALGSLEGQVIQLPIGGTLSKPKLDRGALGKLTAGIVQSFTRGVLQNEVGKQLERFIPLRQQTVPSP